MTNRPRILIVEDDPDVRQITVEVLSGEGYLITEAVGADEALRLLHDIKVDVVVTDVRMPGSMDGWGLTRKLKEMVPPLKVICITGYAENYARRADCDVFLRKPFKLSALLESVQNLLVA